MRERERKRDHTLLMKSRSLILVALLLVLISSVMLGGSVGIEDAYAAPGQNPWPIIE